MLMQWWRGIHINIRVLLIVALVCGIAYPLLDELLWYTDDPEIVRHSVKQASGIACGQTLAHSGAGWTNEGIRPVCDCAAAKFTAQLTPAEMKGLQKHKEQFAPPFQITPAMQPRQDAAVASCSGATGVR